MGYIKARLKRVGLKLGLSWADGLLLLTILFWGVNFSVVKFALAAFPPLVFNGLRFFIASSTMFILVRSAGYSFKFQRRHLPHLIGLGLLGNTTYQILFILGISQTTADNASLMLATVPVWVALFGTLAGTEQVKRGGWLGVALSLSGIVLIVLGSDHEVELQFGGATLTGDILILMGTLCWGGYTLAVRPLMRHYPSPSVTSFATMMGTIPLVLLALPWMIPFNWGQVPISAWGALFFSGVFGIALAYFFWNNGISRLGSARTALYSNLTPSVALFTAWLWLGETLTPQQWGGGLLAIIGVALARRYTYPVRLGK